MQSQRTIMLMASERMTPILRDFLSARDASLRIETPRTIEALRAATARTGGRARLLSFLNGLIIPQDVLAALGPVPYNIHPGPPEYRGAHAESFALWEGAGRFGVTAHEIAARVDEGPIVALSRFNIPAGANRRVLSDITLSEAVKVFALVAAHCLASDASMAPMEESWSGAKRTRREFHALCRSYASAGPAERERLRLACAEDLEEIPAEAA